MKKNYKININKERKWLWEFSKRLMVGVSIFTILITIFILYMIFKTEDMSYISSLIETTSDVFKVSVLGYLVKAGAENVVKVSHSSNIDEQEINTDDTYSYSEENSISEVTEQLESISNETSDI